MEAALGVDGVDGVAADGEHAVALLGPVGVGGAVDLDAVLADGGVGVAVAVEVEDDGVAADEPLGGLLVVALVDGVLVDLVLVVGGKAVEVEGAALAGGLELGDVLGGTRAIHDAVGDDRLDGLGDGLHLLGLSPDDGPGDDGGDAARGDARVAHCPPLSFEGSRRGESLGAVLLACACAEREFDRLKQARLTIR
ncbi:hypothetical protein D3C87_1441300 [compost metagenome]